ncbi:hypothetical protein Geob_3814 [Geotalea daltonii FRC-32]|uniref:DUF3187 family protein n=1 Tax=Geotalea daltonii (strain DSM 22248 / JCM 15807 / FRC-32) TaxID=316067 RepID=B9M7P5_GEODF|nr:DUF3187 family protein [Geotalea daltonii]ACM22151.1 hypothetical protein Geob_3814 [Geotalea daltonii FRC-32]
MKKNRLLPVLAFGCLVFLGADEAPAVEITPFYTQNQSPLVQIFGLPAAGNAVIAASGRAEVTIAQDMASNYAKSIDVATREGILLDGESERTTVALRYGAAQGVEVGLDVPLIGHGGGISDGFIEGWHDFFGLPQGGRKEAPRNRLLYSYEKDGVERLRVDDSSFGIGDVRLSAAYQIYGNGPGAATLRTSLKIPTGSSAKLHGSGSTDLAIWITGSRDNALEKWGHWTIFGAAGGMAMTDGKVLKEQQNNLVGFGTIGIGWSPADVIAFKTQLSAHTPFYGDSSLPELGDSAVQLIMGGTIAFSPTTFLDIGVSEDLAVYTSPDVALHLALTRRF